MSTQSWSSRLRHDSDATFVEWGSDFSSKLAAVGLVQTSDAGQINWGTVTRPGINADAGYEIWRFNDSIQSTAPIFLRFDYGTANGATSQPRIKVTVGTGSNGSGTLTGTALTAASSCTGQTAQTTDTPRQSYMCCVAGFFGFNWKVGTQSCGTLFVARTVDTSGAPTATGAMIHWGGGGVSAFSGRQALRFASPAAAYVLNTAIANGALGMNPQAPTSTSVGSDIQVSIGWTITPRAEPLVGVCGVLASEINPGNTFTFTPVGSTARTYLVWSNEGGPFGSVGNSSAGGMNVAMLWE